MAYTALASLLASACYNFVVRGGAGGLQQAEPSDGHQATTDKAETPSISNSSLPEGHLLT